LVSVSLRGVAVGRIQDSYSQVPRPQLVRLYAANVACALIAGLGVALPVTGAAFAVALGASCVAVAGCDTPTIVDSLVPVVALGSWAATAAYVGVLQIRTLRTSVRVLSSLKLRIR
jgi:hypothetical protein